MEAVPANMKKENDCYFGMSESTDYREDRSRELTLLYKKPKWLAVPLWMNFREVLRPIKEDMYISHLRTAELLGITLLRTVYH